MLHIKSSRRWHGFLFAGFLLVSLAIPLLKSSVALAANCSWQSTTTISCYGSTYTKSSQNGNSMTLSGPQNAACASAEINNITVNPYKTSQKGSLMTWGNAVHKICTPSTSTVTISNTWNSINNGSGGGTGGTGGGTGGTGSGNSGTDTPVCGSGISSWICGIVEDAIVPATEFLDSFINHTLNTNANEIFGSTPGAVSNTGTAANGYYIAWSSFRVLAIAVLIIAGLVMVASQALGFEFLDAYTIRKVLPRLIIAIIGISLSWVLLKFVVQFFDDIGVAIRTLIYHPFAQMNANLGKGPVGIGSITTAAVVGIVGFAFLGVGGVISLLITGFLALAVAFLVLIVREVIIILLIITAPIAIALYILPNTEKVWKIWKDTFLGAMMMYPIISAFIAAGHVFALVSFSQANGSTNAVYQMVGWIGWFAPYFLLPLTFRMATGAVGNIAGMINDRSRGAFDRLKGYRGRKIQENGAAMKAGNRFNSGALNSLTARASTRNLGFGKRGQEELDNKMILAGGDFAKSKHGMASQFKDPVLQAKTYASAAEAKRRMAKDFDMSEEEVDKAIAGARASGGFGRNQQVWAAKQLAATGTGYKDEAQMLSTIARVAGNNSSMADSMWGEARGLAERAGRNDLKAGYTTGTNILSNIQAANRKNGGALSGEQLLRDEGFAAQMDDFGTEAARGVDNMSAMRNKPQAVANMVNRLNGSRARFEKAIADDNSGVRRLTPEQRRATEVQLGQVQAKLENLNDFTSYGPEANAEALHGQYEPVKGQSKPGNRQFVVDEDRPTTIRNTAGEIELGERKVGYGQAQPAAQRAVENLGPASAAQAAHENERVQRGGFDGREEDARRRQTPGPE